MTEVGDVLIASEISEPNAPVKLKIYANAAPADVLDLLKEAAGWSAEDITSAIGHARVRANIPPRFGREAPTE
jgi:hypothetical protein